MSSGLIVLIFIVALILIVGYVVAVILRKRNEALKQIFISLDMPPEKVESNEKKSYTTFRSTMK